jgi:hypothetical protein
MNTPEKRYTIEERKNKRSAFTPIQAFDRVKRPFARGGWRMLTSKSCEAQGLQYRMTASNEDGSNKITLYTWPAHM